MLTYNSVIFNILERRFDQKQLQGYYGGKINQDQTKFFAYTEDQRFWAEFVLKKEHGRYIWLDELS